MSGATSVRERGLAAWREARYADALADARKWIEDEPRSPHAHQLAAKAAARLGDAGAAAREFETAETLGAGIVCAFNAGIAWKAAGETARAIAAWRRAAADPSTLGRKALALGRMLADAGESAFAARAFHSLVRQDPLAFDATQALVTLAANDRDAAVSPLPMPEAGDSPPPASLSFVVCSIDDAKFASLAHTIASRFSGVEHDVVRISDAASLCEGYMRGIERARGEALVLCHDDIDLLAPDAAARLLRHLTRADLVGVAGTRVVTGPAVFRAGHPHVHGWVTHRLPEESDYEPSFLSLEGPHVAGMAALDGVLMACRRGVVQAVGFDAATFDGFHLYDLDFSYRAHLAGYRLGVACDLGIVHASKGSFGAEWDRYAARFRAKFPALSGQRGAPHYYAVRVPSASDVLGVQRRLSELVAS